ncbi:MAG: NADH-quinone oxidoreductase subunit NuoK [Syntrophobacterales bacterium]|jgi:NADH:ubiquinone oxidoreductase subunit K|nr:NADH-quinone oxidoreductase subunit NuoK [Syntrophobacterales bacterium]
MTDTLLFNNLYVYLFVALFLISAGILGVLYRKTLIGMLISLELVMNGVGLNFVALSRLNNGSGVAGQVFTLFIMGIAAAEAAIALGLIIFIFRRYRHIESEKLKEMKD